MDLYKIICPYYQFGVYPQDYDQGYRALVCMNCNKPFVNQTTMTPVFHSFALVGVDSPKVHDVDEYYRDEESEQNGPECEQKQDFCEQNIEESEQKGIYVNSCAKCGFVFEDHDIAPEGVCPICFLDEDSVKGLPDERKEFKPLVTNYRVQYREDGEYIEVKYAQNAPIRTTWADIWTLVDSEDRHAAIMELMDVKEKSPKVTGLRQFVDAVALGNVPGAAKHMAEGEA